MTFELWKATFHLFIDSEKGKNKILKSAVVTAIAKPSKLIRVGLNKEGRLRRLTVWGGEALSETLM